MLGQSIVPHMIAEFSFKTHSTVEMNQLKNEPVETFDKVSTRIILQQVGMSQFVCMETILL